MRIQAKSVENFFSIYNSHHFIVYCILNIIKGPEIVRDKMLWKFGKPVAKISCNEMRIFEKYSYKKKDLYEIFIGFHYIVVIGNW